METTNLIRLKDPDNYPAKLKNILDILTFNEAPKVVGSYSFQNHKYPSDVDVFEQVKLKLNKEAAIKFYVNGFQKIFHKLLVLYTKVFIADFKAGENTLIKKIWDNPSLSLYNKDIKTELSTLLPPAQLQILYTSRTEKEFKENLREYLVIRWNPEEILLGYKYVLGNKLLTLADAISQPAVIKLDVITWIDNRFQSIEVFYSLNYMDNNKYVEFYPLGDYSANLIKDIKKYSRKDDYNPLKVAKRIWSLSRVEECNDTLIMLNPLMESNAAALNQVSSEIEIITTLLKIKFNEYTKILILNKESKLAEINKLDDHYKTKNQIFMEILSLSKKIINHISLDIYISLNGLFDNIFNLWTIFKATNNFQFDQIFKYLNELDTVISAEIKREASLYLENITKVNNFYCELKK
jgi:hypothetical protein